MAISLSANRQKSVAKFVKLNDIAECTQEENSELDSAQSQENPRGNNKAQSFDSPEDFCSLGPKNSFLDDPRSIGLTVTDLKQQISNNSVKGPSQDFRHDEMSRSYDFSGLQNRSKSSAFMNQRHSDEGSLELQKEILREAQELDHLLLESSSKSSKTRDGYQVNSPCLSGSQRDKAGTHSTRKMDQD
mmetsp:Transcript_10247/g.17250  ORF Transcript_10247/g.17250 Transcript_10247/m.17250 type:complete len:188 (+) Transcript_10247:173-736(+)